MFWPLNMWHTQATKYTINVHYTSEAHENLVNFTGLYERKSCLRRGPCPALARTEAFSSALQ